MSGYSHSISGYRKPKRNLPDIESNSRTIRGSYMSSKIMEEEKNLGANEGSATIKDQKLEILGNIDISRVESASM